MIQTRLDQTQTWQVSGFYTFLKVGRRHNGVSRGPNSWNGIFWRAFELDFDAFHRMGIL